MPGVIRKIRNAVTGQYATKAYAGRHPRTTVTEEDSLLDQAARDFVREVASIDPRGRTDSALGALLRQRIEYARRLVHDFNA